MNISSHLLLPTRFKMGFCRPNGDIVFPSYVSRSLTHFFPISILGFKIFYLPKNAISLFGETYVVTSSSYFRVTFLVSSNGVLSDSTTPVFPSNPFTYILY